MVAGAARTTYRLAASLYLSSSWVAVECLAMSRRVRPSFGMEPSMAACQERSCGDGGLTGSPEQPSCLTRIDRGALGLLYLVLGSPRPPWHEPVPISPGASKLLRPFREYVLGSGPASAGGPAITHPWLAGFAEVPAYIHAPRLPRRQQQSALSNKRFRQALPRNAQMTL